MSEAVLVTGGAGYIGSHACKVLARAGYRPVVFDNLSRGHREAVRWGPLVEGDLAERGKLAAALADHRVSASCISRLTPMSASRSPIRHCITRNNLGGSLSLLDAMREAGVDKIVFSSTCATYGTPAQVPIRETMPQLPVNPYGETKLAIERALHWYGEAYGLRWVSLRYFNAAGADPDGEIGERHEPETHLVPLVLQAALGRPAANRHLRNRLPDAGRDGDPRLHSCPGSRRGASARARTSRAPGGRARRSTSAPAAVIRCAR